MKIKNMNNAGTTLVELMVYMIVGLIVITGAFKIISNATGSYVHGRAVSKAQYNARDGVASMSRDIASMGFKTYFKDNAMVIDTPFVNEFSYIPDNSPTNTINNVPVGDTLEFSRIQIEDNGERKSRQIVKYYLDKDNNNLKRKLYKISITDFSDTIGEDSTIIASNVVALKFRFSIIGDGSDWVPTTFPASVPVFQYDKNEVRNVEISMLVKGTENKKGTGSYGAAEYDVGGYKYHTPPNDLQIVHRLYQQAVEVPNNGRGID